MKKIIFILALILGTAVAHALPFTPTSDPTLINTSWYFIKSDGFYLIATGDGFETDFISSPSAANDYHIWCFVGDEESGYRVYNKGLGLYLGLGTFHAANANVDDGEYIHVEYQDETYFNLRYDYLSTYYLFMHAYTDQYGTMRYIDISPWPMAPFSVDPAITWTRHDTNGVGYSYVEGGEALTDDETASNLCDDNALTKYYGNASNCWVTIKSSDDVAVGQYSIVTTGDTRQYYGRSLRSWKLQGSNDNVNWEDIDVRNDFPMPFEDQAEVVIKINDTRKFSFFKFTCTQGAGNVVQLSEVWINEESHDSWTEVSTQDNSCGYPQVRVMKCNKCNVSRTELIEPSTSHNYTDGVCAGCGINEHETMLLYNGQRLAPYYVKALHASRGSDGTWPSPPAGWNEVDYDDSDWIDLALPTASPDHSNGPFYLLQYNSHWYGEYNCYWMRRTFNLERVNTGDSFILHCVHDDNMVVYVNGQQVINAEGWTANASTWDNSYDSFVIPASAFTVGENVLAIYMQQNWGGAYFDCDLRLKRAVVAGDVNGDGDVTSADITALYGVLLSNDYSSIVNGDQDGDGNITSGDVTAVYSILLGSNEPVEHTYVDLGLPSGTLWATTNVGATSPEGFGNYFAWGETSPKSTYTWGNYHWCNGTNSSLTKYSTNSALGIQDNKVVLDTEDDAATQNWGAEWQMPSHDQVEELCNECIIERTTLNGVNGRLFTSKHNGSTLFMPTAGHYDGDNLVVNGVSGYYLTRDLYTSNCILAWILSVTTNSSSSGSRYKGYSVRPVRKQ